MKNRKIERFLVKTTLPIVVFSIGSKMILDSYQEVRVFYVNRTSFLSTKGRASDVAWDASGGRGVRRLRYTIQYQVSNSLYECNQSSGCSMAGLAVENPAEYLIGKMSNPGYVVVYYDPSNPHVARLHIGNPISYLSFFLIGVLIVILSGGFFILLKRVF